MKKYKQLLLYMARQWKSLAGVGVLTVAASGLSALQPLPLKVLVDFGLKNGQPPRELISLVESIGSSPDTGSFIVLAAVASLLFFVLNALVDAGLMAAWTNAGQSMVRDLSTDMFARLQRMPLREYTRVPVGDSLSRLSTDAWCVYTLSDGFLTPFQQIAQIVTLGLVAWTLDPQLSMFALALAPVLGTSSIYFGRRMKKRAQQNREAQSRVLSFVHQTLTAMPIVQAFSTEDTNGRRLRVLASAAVESSQRGVIVSSKYSLVNGLVLTAGMAALLWVGGTRVMSATLSVGTLLVFITYMRNLQNSVAGLLRTYATLKPVEASVDRVLEVFSMAPPPSAMRDGKSLSCSTASIAFENVSFEYEPGVPVLKNVSLRLDPGERVGIVGRSGQGKSTLLALISRFIDPQDGRITINNIDVSELSIETLRSHIAVVLQEPMLLPITIGENIAYGRTSATREEIEAAARAANAHLFIERLPQGYETVVGERGSTLSGGEKQRIAIARAILKNAPILILDEPTSALDSITEAEVLSAIERLMEGRTTLAVAHRFSTVRSAHRIYSIDGGSVSDATAAHLEATA